MSGKVTAIILAGGTGKRMKSRVPKQFLDLCGKPVIVHSLERFAASKIISDIVIVSHPDHVGTTGKMVRRFHIPKIYKILKGGSTRQRSSFIGVKGCAPDTRYVLIHDAARPFVKERMLRDVLSTAKRYGAAGPAIETGDTIIEEERGCIKNIPRRRTLKRIQTPQGFAYDKILNAHLMALKRNIKNCTDDCGLVISTGGKVKIVKGDPENIKITVASDLGTTVKRDRR